MLWIGRDMAKALTQNVFRKVERWNEVGSHALMWKVIYEGISK